MFGKRITLFRLLGFEVRLDASWLILAALVTWSLASGYFPAQYPDFSQATYWWMGAAGAFGLFVSIVLHELAHSLVARREGIEMKGITLFIFGGVAEMDSEPPSAGAEIKMAIAGPAMSLVLGGAAYAGGLAFETSGALAPAAAVLEHLGFLNVALAVFNMIPAFPLDGGRVLRGVLWRSGKSLRQATRVTSAIGGGFGFLLIVLGVVSLMSGNFIGGLWWALIGMFIRGASQSSYQQVALRETFEGETVAEFIRREPVTVFPSVSLRSLVDDYVYPYHFRMFPVVDIEGRLEGCVRVRDLQSVPKQRWDEVTVRDVMTPPSEDNTIAPDTDVLTALQRMQRSSISSVVVVEDGRPVGVVTLRDLMDFLGLKLDLGGGEAGKPAVGGPKSGPRPIPAR